MVDDEVPDLVGRVIGDEPVPGFGFLNPAEWAISGCFGVVCMKRLDKNCQLRNRWVYNGTIQGEEMEIPATSGEATR